MSGLAYQRKIQEWKIKGYEVILYYFQLPTVEMAVERVKLRVSEGGHDIPEGDIKRRFVRSKHNFDTIYKDLVDVWVLFDNTQPEPRLIESSYD